MRIIVDAEACTGHARCEAVAPDVYVLDDDGFNTMPVTEVPSGLEEQALLGCNACPEGAITLEE